MNKKIIDYIVVTEYTASHLTKSVLEYIEQGWQPLESAKFTINSLGNIYYMQTLVKYAKKEKVTSNT